MLFKAHSDAALLERWQSTRDSEAFAELVARHSAMVYRTAHRILRKTPDAEDVVQECFSAIAESSHAVRKSLAGWLHALTVSRALDRLKADRRRVARETHYRNDAPKTVGPEWDEISDLVDRAIAQLPRELQDAIVCRYLEGNTIDKTAAILGVSKPTVRSRVEKAVNAVRATLRQQGVAVPVAVLFAGLADGAVEAVPSTLTASLGRLAVAGGKGMAPPSANRTAKTWNSTPWQFGTKTLVGLGLVAAILAGSHHYLPLDEGSQVAGVKQPMITVTSPPTTTSPDRALSSPPPAAPSAANSAGPALNLFQKAEAQPAASPAVAAKSAIYNCELVIMEADADAVLPDTSSLSLSGDKDLADFTVTDFLANMRKDAKVINPASIHIAGHCRFAIRDGHEVRILAQAPGPSPTVDREVVLVPCKLANATLLLSVLINQGRGEPFPLDANLTVRVETAHETDVDLNEGQSARNLSRVLQGWSTDWNMGSRFSFKPGQGSLLVFRPDPGPPLLLAFRVSTGPQPATQLPKSSPERAAESFEEALERAHAYDRWELPAGVGKDDDRAIENYRRALALRSDDPENLRLCMRIAGLLELAEGDPAKQEQKQETYEQILQQFNYMDYYEPEPDYGANSLQFTMITAAIYAMGGPPEHNRSCLIKGMEMLNQTYQRRVEQWLNEPEPKAPISDEFIIYTTEVRANDPEVVEAARNRRQERQERAEAGDVFEDGLREMTLVKTLVRDYVASYGDNLPPEEVERVTQPIIARFPHTPFEKEVKRVIEAAKQSVKAAPAEGR